MIQDDCPIEMPGSEAGIDMPKPSSPIHRIETKLAESQTLVDSIRAKIPEAITGTLDAACKVGDNCKGIVEGKVLRGLDSVEAKLRRPLLKVEQSLIDRISLIYTLLGSFGVSWPMDGDVAYGLVTGDYLGSVGIKPREYEITGEGGERYNGYPTPPPSPPPSYGTFPTSTPSPPQGSSGTAPPPSPQPVGGEGSYNPAGETQAKPNRVGDGIGTPNSPAGCPPQNVTVNNYFDESYIPVDPTERAEKPEISEEPGYVRPKWFDQEFPTLPPPPPPPTFQPERTKKQIALEQFNELLVKKGFLGLVLPPSWNEPLSCWHRAELSRMIKDAGIDLSKALGDPGKDSSIPLWLKLASPIVGVVSLIVGDGSDGKGEDVMKQWLPDAPQWVRNTLRTVLSGLLKIVGNASQLVPANGNCDIPAMTVPAMAKMILSPLNKWLGGALDDLLTGYDYWINSLCPTLLPSAGEAHEGYLNGVVNQEVRDCWTRANNVLDKPMDTLTYGRRTRPDVFQVISLWMRGWVGDAEKNMRLRELGVLNSQDQHRLQQSQEAWPGISDMIRFLVRDVDDQEIVEQFGMDDDFAKKWGKDLKKFAKGIGLSDDLAKLYWRAHWDLPSPTQLFEMLHRLRPGRFTEVPPELRNVVRDVKDLEVNAEDVKTVLQQNDLLPYWVPRMMALSYHPLNLTDLRRAYNIRSINQDELRNGFLDLGYTKENAEILVKFYTDDRTRRELKKPLPRTATDILNSYIRSEIDEVEADTLLFKLEIPQARIKELIRQADIKKQLYERKLLVARVKKQYERAEIGLIEATRELALAGLRPDSIQRIQRSWIAKRSKGPKEASAAQLCKWRGLNLITPQEQLRRLRELGWTEKDARRIVGECVSDLTEKEKKRIEKEKKEAERIKKEAEKKEKERKKEEEKKKKEEGGK